LTPNNQHPLRLTSASAKVCLTGNLMTPRIARATYTLLAILFSYTLVVPTSAQTQPNTPIPIVFVHGNGDDASKWIGIIWLFESNNYPADKLFSIRFSHPNARANDTVEEENRSSTTDATAELSAFVTRVLIETHTSKVALIGSSRGGLTIRNYLLHGGSNNVAIAITCGTPNHGVIAMDTNLDGEFNGKGRYLQSLNHAYGDSSEVPPGVRIMTLRSDKLDKYAQPNGMAFGQPQTVTGVTYAGPALAGATNIVIPNLDHRELAFYPSAFAAMYQFITGKAPGTTSVTPIASPVISGLITGFENGTFTNLPIAGAHLRIYPVTSTESTTPVYQTVTKADGKWGPFQASSPQEYDFDLEYQGRHIRFYKAPIPRSTSLLNLRLLPVPAKSKDDVQPGSPTPQHQTELFIDRPQGYLSRERDPVLIDNKIASDEPSGLPLNDSFLADLTTPPTQLVTVTLRKETIAARPSNDLATDLPVVDFLW
jgi:triacylglycerol lipase